jgi:hypothetical protein
MTSVRRLQTQNLLASPLTALPRRMYGLVARRARNPDCRLFRGSLRNCIAKP